MVDKESLAAKVIRITAYLVFITSIFVVWQGWYLPEPQYTADSYAQVLAREFGMSMKNVIINTFVFLIPLYIISFSLKPSLKKFSFMRLVITGLVALGLGIVIVVFIVSKSLAFWFPLEKATHHIERRVFTRGRGGNLGLQKEYIMHFSTKTPNLLFIKNQIVPNLQLLGYTVDSFGLQIRGKRYMSNSSKNKDIIIESVYKIPLETTLLPNDVGVINFRKDKTNTINFVIDRLEGNNTVTGYLQSYH